MKKIQVFFTYELEPGVYSFKDLSKSLCNIPKPEDGDITNSVVIEMDDITMEYKLVVRVGIIAIRFDEKSFFSTILCFNHGWDYKHYNEYISQKYVNLSVTKEIHLNCDVIDGSVVNGLRQPNLYSFALDKLPGYKVFSEPETIQYKKMNKSVLNTITLYLEEDNIEEVDFIGETWTFTIQMIKN